MGKMDEVKGNKAQGIIVSQKGSDVKQDVPREHLVLISNCHESVDS